MTLALVRDRAAWRDWLSRFSPIGPDPLDRDTWGVVQDVALMVIGLLVAQLVVFELRNWIEPGMYVRDPALFGVGLVSSILFAVLLDQGAVLEEGGWRGYATPLLQNRNVSPLKVAILIGTVWGLWHVPRDVVTGVIERLGMFEYLALFLPSFVFGTITMSVIASYFMNRLGGSVWPAIIVHGLGNDAMGFSGLVTIEQALTPYHQITKAIPFALVALLIVAASGRRLGRP
ncbi:MAG: CPBP family intramembrane metalloprotease [Deltaproteobacteria bacterium]|nr:CPBP family intramembrane metalloprotease [Deltaproteobacteria bacterium]